MREELKAIVEWEGPAEVGVEWDAAPLPMSAKAAAFIEERWTGYEAEGRARGKILFNGPITRLVAARVEAAAGRQRVVLRLGPADYKTFVVTRLRDRAWFEAHAPESVVEALGNSALLTHGNRALLGVRSEKVSAYPGRAHLFGGVAELLGTEKFPATAAGLIAHLRLELHEEAGIEAGELAAEGPRLMGLAYDDFLGQPELFWRWETSVPLEEVARRLDLSEHAGGLIVERGAVEAAVREQMTPVARRTMEAWAAQA